MISEVDERLHVDRTSRKGKVALRTLPVGTMFEHAGEAYVVTSGGHFRWSFDGYTQEALPKSEVELLTPMATVLALRAGYIPAIHPSADA